MLTKDEMHKLFMKQSYLLNDSLEDLLGSDSHADMAQYAFDAIKAVVRMYDLQEIYVDKGYMKEDNKED